MTSQKCIGVVLIRPNKTETSTWQAKHGSAGSQKPTGHSLLQQQKMRNHLLNGVAWALTQNSSIHLKRPPARKRLPSITCVKALGPIDHEENPLPVRSAKQISIQKRQAIAGAACSNWHLKLQMASQIVNVCENPVLALNKQAYGTHPMKDQRRLVLWANDSPRNSVDLVCETIVTEIERHLDEAEEDSCFVNDVVAYIRCLSGVYDWAGGGFIELEVLESWRTRAVTVVEQMAGSYFENESERADDLAFVNEVFSDLRKIMMRMYD